MKNKTSILALFILCALSAMAVPHRWVAEVSRPVAEEVFAFQGETIEFYPDITAYGEPFIADAYQLHYQTNGMGGLFFSGAITTNLPVLFTPSMDIGATSYSFFVESTNTVGICFRSYGTIRMKKSPGFSPNSIPLPVQRIDFATITTTNAPWLLTENLALTITSHDTDPSAHETILAAKVSTNDPVYLATVALAATALQNPESATNFMWVSDGTAITITGYSGASTDVVLPDYLDGHPVTGFGQTFRETGITSISGGNQVLGLAFSGFYNCPALTNVSLLGVTHVGSLCFVNNSLLKSVRIGAVTSIGEYAFHSCFGFESLYVSGDQPSTGDGIFFGVSRLTVYVTSLTATGWASTFGGRPVVRQGTTHGTCIISGDASVGGSMTFGGVTRTNWPTGLSAPDATNAALAVTSTHNADANAHSNLITSAKITAAGGALASSLAGYVQTNDSRVVNAVTNNYSGAVTFGGALSITGDFIASNVFRVATGQSYSGGVGTATTGAPRLFLGSNTSSGDDSAILIGRSLTGSGLFSHGLRDESTFNVSGAGAYASFDTVIKMGGTNAYNHLIAFQARPNFSGTSSVSEMASFYSWSLVSSGTVSAATGLHIQQPTVMPGAVLTYCAQILLESQTNAVTNYGIYQNGPQPNYFSGLLQTGTNGILTTGQIKGSNLYTDSGANTVNFGVGTPQKGYYDCFIGHNSGKNLLTGSFNTFLGASSGYNCNGSSGNVYIGYNAGYGGNGSNNVFVGKEAGYHETGSSKFILDNTKRSSEADARQKALMYGVFSSAAESQQLTVNATLSVNGAIKIGPTIGGNQAYLTSNGTNLWFVNVNSVTNALTTN